MFAISAELVKARIGCPIEVYRVSDDEQQLGIGELVLFSLLSGGDYSNGLPGVGPAITQGLSRYNLGQELYQAAQELPVKKLAMFLPNWRCSLLEMLHDDPCCFLPKHRHGIDIPDNFPNLELVLLYVKPLTSWSNNGKEPFDRASLVINQPNLARLATLCLTHFTWGTRDGILQKFRSVLWGPCLARALYADIFGDNMEHERGTSIVNFLLLRSVKNIDAYSTGSSHFPDCQGNWPTVGLSVPSLPCRILTALFLSRHQGDSQ